MLSYFFLFFLLTSCGYRLDTPLGFESKPSISVPFVNGDFEGKLTNAIVQALCESGSFRYQKHDGRLNLLVTVFGGGDERIGFRYDRNPKTGKRRHNLIGTENRRTILVEVKVIDTFSDKILLGPSNIAAEVDYDYVDGSSIVDLSFINLQGIRETVISFSLGQLDSKDGASIDALSPLYRIVAQKIVDGILVHDLNESSALNL
ncbi:MAG: hypothetical protein L0207_01545 [Chlamydiae bacterium]|nr:hypothetical protein [Chlamydiota bacterium]